MKGLRVMSVICAQGLASAAHSAAGDKASAQMKDRDGKVIGTITLIEPPQGVLLAGDLNGLPPGPHGFHLHAAGQCEPPFTSAGGHFNPDNKKHGFHDAGGAYAGDLPNLHSMADGGDSGDRLNSRLAADHAREHALFVTFPVACGPRMVAAQSSSEAAGRGGPDHPPQQA